MPRRSILWLAALAWFGVVGPARAGRPPVQSYDLSRGLVGDRVWDLELDGAGALWIATSTGVSRFDGVRFRNFDVRHGLPNDNVIRLLRLADGRLAAGTGAGVALLDPIGGVGETPWRKLPAEVERDGGLLDELVEDGAGRLWAGGLLGLFRVDGASGEERLVGEPLPAENRGVRLLAADAAAGLWVHLRDGLYRRSADGEWVGPWSLPDALDDAAGVTDLLVDSSGVLWAASRRAICSVATGDEPPPTRGPLVAVPPLVDLAAAGPLRAAGASFCVGLDGGLPATQARRQLEPARAGTLFVTGASGVLEIGAERLALRWTASDVGGASLQSVLEGPDGTLWVGTGDRGLVKLLRTGLELAGEGEPLPGRVSTLLVGGAQVHLVVDQIDPRRRLLRVEEDRFVDVTPPGAAEFEGSWGWGPISAIGPDRAWWVGRSGGILRFPRRGDDSFGAPTTTPERLATALAHEEPIRLFFASDGALWVASHDPVDLHRAELTGDRVETFAEVAGFPNGAPSALAEGVDGTIWLGFFRGGLARRRDGGRFEWLSGSADLVRGFVYALRFDRGGRLWIAAGGGLALCRTPTELDPRCERALPGSELDHLQVFGFAEDSHGRLLVGSSKGLSVIDPASRRIDRVTTAEGLPGNTVAAVEPAADGGAWIAADRGLAHLSPSSAGAEPSPIRIVALDIAGRPYPVAVAGLSRTPRIELASGERIVEIEVASVFLGSGAPPAYQWRVDAGEWSEPSTERRLRLAGLATGDLTVEARAISGAGFVGPDVARVDLRVLPPIWRRGWFFLLLASTAIALLVAAHRARVRRLLEMERVRTRIAADLHDDLGSALSRISILAEVARRQAPAGGGNEATLETIGASARDLAEMASDIVWATDPQRDDLGSWVARIRRFGEDLFAPQGVHFEVVSPESLAGVHLPAASRRDLYLLAKEALNNAAKYAGARRVQVVVATAGGRLELAIEDDGRGFDAAAQRTAEERGGGRGLRSMRERAERLGGRLEVGARAGGAGTRIALTFEL